MFMLRCAELGLTDDALSGMTCGMVYDMYAEKLNDQEKYPVLADQDDIEAFFGEY